jgi:signal transduction histidine kinase/ActR/RegA family two-component response regulator
MPTRDAPSQKSLQLTGGEGTAHGIPVLNVEQLEFRINGLLDEIAVLRNADREKAALRDTVAQLREANQNLVLATLNAQTLREEADLTNQRQNEFLAMLAHELRNPLAPISMAASMLQRMEGVTPRVLKFQEIISRQVTHLTRLLDDLLDAARISSGKVTLLLEPVLLSEVIEHTIETIQLRLVERRQTLKVDVPAEPIVINADQMRLAQVFSNLLVNASKFTQDQGELAITVKLVGKNVIVTVEDNGVGIAAAVIPHIFALFTQGPRSLARSEGGLGVGLSVVRNIVQMHGGKVEAHSLGLGAGSQFSVTLPISNDALYVSSGWQPAQPDSPGRRILLIEDNLDANETMMNFLSMEGHTVSNAYDGTTGLAMALAQRYDVLICDIGLPGIDGFGIIEALHAAAGADVPFAIALSGYGQLDDRSRALAAGFDHYFVKPVNIEALLPLISSGSPNSRSR